MKIIVFLIFFIYIAVSVGSSYAQNFQIPEKHLYQHDDLIKSQYIAKCDDSKDKSLENNLQNYFYPVEEIAYAYLITPNADNPRLIASYRKSDSKLYETVEIWNGHYGKPISEVEYKFAVDEFRHAIVSYNQTSRSLLGFSRGEDHITMFVLPQDNNSVNWTESVNGESSKCSAKFVYISVIYQGKRQYCKAVRIEKTTSLGKSRYVKEWSYWVKGLGRLATYGYSGDPKKVSCIEKSIRINLDDQINEISKAEYDSLK